MSLNQRSSLWMKPAGWHLRPSKLPSSTSGRASSDASAVGSGSEGYRSRLRARRCRITSAARKAPEDT
eukprot:3101964-Lingulodinium_polyedra.AAC.1